MKYVPDVKRHPALQDVGVVKQLMDSHAELAMQQAIQETASRFGISQEEVLHILRGGDFLVKRK